MFTDAIPPKMASTLYTLGKTIELKQMAAWKQIVRMMLNF